MPWLLNTVIKNFDSQLTKQQAFTSKKELDSRISSLPPYPGLRRFPDGISSLSKLRGADYNAVYTSVVYLFDALVSKEEQQLFHKRITAYFFLFRSRVSEGDLKLMDQAYTEYSTLISFF
jgi:hypothetical protein